MQPAASSSWTGRTSRPTSSRARQRAEAEGWTTDDGQAFLQEDVGDEAVEAGGRGAGLHVARPTPAAVQAEVGAVAPADEVAERAAAVAQDEGQVRVGGARGGYLAGQAANDVGVGDGLVILVGDDRTAQLNEDRCAQWSPPHRRW